MAAPIEHRCARCGALLGRAPGGPVAIGRPFSECVCGAFVERPPFNEWDLLPAGSKLGYLGKEAAVALSLGLLPGLFLLIGTRVLGREVEMRTVVLLIVLGLAAFGALSAARNARAIARSRQRLSDPMYLAKLAEFGMASQAPAEGLRPEPGSLPPR